MAQIVKNEPSHDYYVGYIAAKRLADLEIATVRNLTDQAELAKIAKNYEVRIAAAETPTDQAPLAEIAKNIRKCVRIAAVETLADQALLTSIARSDGEYYVREAAVERLTVLARQAEILKRQAELNKETAKVRSVRDQAALAEIAKTEHRNPQRGVAAVKNLTDPKLLASVAEIGLLGDVRDRAIRKLRD